MREWDWKRERRSAIEGRAGRCRTSREGAQSHRIACRSLHPPSNRSGHKLERACTSSSLWILISQPSFLVSCISSVGDNQPQLLCNHLASSRIRQVCLIIFDFYRQRLAPIAINSSHNAAKSHRTNAIWSFNTQSLLGRYVHYSNFSNAKHRDLPCLNRVSRSIAPKSSQMNAPLFAECRQCVIISIRFSSCQVLYS